MESAAAILALVPQISWFSAAGASERHQESEAALLAYCRHCGDWPGRWATGWPEAAQVVRDLNDETSFWKVENDRRKRALAAAHSAGRSGYLADLLHDLSIVGYEVVRPAAPSEELARVASGAALWTAAEAITWSVVNDLLMPETNPFMPKLRLFELGHWPLGLWRGAVVVM